MSSEVTFPELDFKVNGIGRLKFASLDDVRAWLKKEQDFFRPIFHAQPARHHGTASPHLDQLRQRQEAVERTINEAEQTLQNIRRELKNDPSQAARLKTTLERSATGVSAQIDAHYSAPDGVWHSEAPESKFVKKLAETNVNEAAFAMVFLRGLPFQPDSVPAQNGIFKAQLFKFGITELRSTAEDAALTEVKEKWKSDASKMGDEFATLREDMVGLNGDLRGKIDAEKSAAELRAGEFKNFIGAKDQEFLRQRQSASDELKKLIETYDQFMKLKAPVDYWRAKKVHHLNARDKLRWWVVGTAVVMFAALGLYVDQTFHTVDAGKIPWRELLGFFVLSSIAFWVVRILVRLLLSAIHLAEDASERAVMAETYMALVRGDDTKAKYLDEKDRALVLAPLFRPSATGIVSDDAAPVQIADLLAKIARK